MSEVTKEDIAAVHSRIDEIVTCNTAIQVSIGKIQQRFEDLTIPKQPCSELRNHIKDHKENVRIWQRPIVHTIVDLVKLGIVAFLTYVFVKREM